mmetsp:Transcript_20988/g.34456  ORF Transcript_20988/g.34456 Transcript_20988/m.34456 type:complete len:85 (+) Transcript_20988:203-457(+)
MLTLQYFQARKFTDEKYVEEIRSEVVLTIWTVSTTNSDDFSTIVIRPPPPPLSILCESEIRCEMLGTGPKSEIQDRVELGGDKG